MSRKPRLFNVKFENSIAVFHNGQKINGTVYIEDDESFDIEGRLPYPFFNNAII